MRYCGAPVLHPACIFSVVSASVKYITEIDLALQLRSYILHLTLTLRPLSLFHFTRVSLWSWAVENFEHRSLQNVSRGHIVSLYTFFSFFYLTDTSLCVYLPPSCSCVIFPISLFSLLSSQIAEQLMTLAYENGINLFDTAEVYAAGKWVFIFSASLFWDFVDSSKRVYSAVMDRLLLL